MWVSPDRASSLPALWRLLLGLALYYGLANGLRQEPQRRWLPLIVLLASLALTALTLLGTAWQAVRFFNLPQLYNYLPRLLRDVQDQNAFHPRTMGLALGAWLPLPLALCWFGRGRRYRLLASAASLAMGLTLLLTQSLQAAVGLACALLFLGFCWRRWFLLAAPLLLVALAWSLSAYGLPRVAQAALSVNSPLGIAASLRLDMWSRALAMIRDLPYTGIGLDAFPTVQWNFYPGVLLGPEPHAHNLFLQVALDLGLPGLLAFLWLLGSLASVAYASQDTPHTAAESTPHTAAESTPHTAAESTPHTAAGVTPHTAAEDTLPCAASHTPANPQHRALLLGALAGVVSYVGTGFLDTMWTAKPAVLLWVLLGLQAALSAPAQPAGPPSTGRLAARLWRRALSPLLLFALLLPGLLLSRGAPWVNLAAARAHPLLLAVRASAPSVAPSGLPALAQPGQPPSALQSAPSVPESLTSLSADLQQAVHLDPTNAQMHHLLGLTLAWTGQQPEALSALRQRVALDGHDPLARYAPFELWQRRLAGEPQRDRWEDLAWVYGHWVSRFPLRAENHVLLALVRAEQQGRTQEAERFLRLALERRAQPAGLLWYGLEAMR